jgi:hypothetical protein
MSSVTTAAVPVPVPREYIGKARLFRGRIEAAAALSNPPMKAIARNAAVDLQRRYMGTRQASSLAETERRWRALPPSEQLSIAIKRTTTTLEINDVRLAANTLAHDGFINELAVTIVRSTVSVDPPRCINTTIPIDTVSFHAMGRFFQRYPAADADALMAALVALAQATGDLLHIPGEFRVPALGGQWRGEVALLGTVRDPNKAVQAMHVRTFIWHD